MVMSRLVGRRWFGRAGTGSVWVRRALGSDDRRDGSRRPLRSTGWAAAVAPFGVLCALAVVATGCTSAGEQMVPAELAASDPSTGPTQMATNPATDTNAGHGRAGNAHSGAGSSGGAMTGMVMGSADSVTDPAPPTTVANIANIAEIPAVTRAQQLLLAQGFDVGPIDGTVGAATVAAISAFQAKSARTVTGLLDAATYRALLDATVEVADQMPASVIVDLSDQRVLVHNGRGDLVTYWPISTGGPGYETPTGSFVVQSRQRVGTSSGDERVHMDYFTVFNEDIGFHGIPWVSTRDNRLFTPLGEYGVSHGCIRMEDSNAEYLYSFLADGAPVEVRD